MSVCVGLCCRSLVIAVSLGFLYIFVVIYPVFLLLFFSARQDIGCEEHLPNDVLCVE